MKPKSEVIVAIQLQCLLWVFHVHVGARVEVYGNSIQYDYIYDLGQYLYLGVAKPPILWIYLILQGKGTNIL